MLEQKNEAGSFTLRHNSANGKKRRPSELDYLAKNKFCPTGATVIYQVSEMTGQDSYRGDVRATVLNLVDAEKIRDHLETCQNAPIKIFKRYAVPLSGQWHVIQAHSIKSFVQNLPEYLLTKKFLKIGGVFPSALDLVPGFTSLET